ncbi:MAG: hypothetical protein QNJ98_05440 [Planctomycetota bacterium]|nr:hypothetical protein [Planctomycetota bacterium]
MRALRTPIALLLLMLCAGTACNGSGSSTPSAAPGDVVPARFARIAGLLRQGRTASAAGDVARVTALRQPLAREGLALLEARIPNDLRRQDMPRFLSARRQFGDALTQYVAAIEAGDGAGTLAAFRALDDATQGWIDAYLGRPTEAAV